MNIAITIAFGCLIFCGVILMLGTYGIRHDLEQKRISSVVSGLQKTEYVDEELSKPLSERFFWPILRGALRMIPKSSRGEQQKKQNEKLKKMIRQAGMTIQLNEYTLLRTTVMAGAGLLMGMVGSGVGSTAGAIVGVLFGVYSAYVVMRFQLTAQISKRQTEMEEKLPDVLDLLSINVEAGLGFEQALLQVIDHYEGYLIDELTITYREMSMGRTRREALSVFAERCDLNDIKNFVGAIIQAEQLGISIKNVLRTQAAAIRISRRNRVEEKAMKISVKILIPMVCFIFPVLLIVLMGPAAVQIYHQFMG